MAVTLADKAMLEKDPLRKGIIVGLLKTTFIMEKLPIETIGKLQQKVLRWKDLPNVAWRRVNGSFPESTGTTEQIMESIYVLGGDIDIDTVIAKSNDNITDPRALQVNMKLKSIGYEFNDRFINGDTANDPLGFDGLKVRVAALPADQTIDAAGLDLSTDNGKDINAHKLLDLVDAGFAALDDGRPTLILCNRKFKLAFKSVLRRADLLDHTKDMFDRKIDAYDGVPFLDMGYKADQKTQIIADDHDGNGNTSIYLVKFGSEEYLGGIQEYDIDTRDLGEAHDKPALRTRMEWPIGLAMWSERCIVRIKGIKVA